MTQRTFSLPTVILQDRIFPVMRLFLLPFQIGRAIWAVVKSDASGRYDWITDEVLSRIDVPVAPLTNEELDALSYRAARLAEQGGITGVADLLQAHDDMIDQEKGGLRAYKVIVDAALKDEALERIEMGESPLPHDLSEAVAPYEDALAADPMHAGLAVLTARKHMQVAWAYRGCGYVHGITDKQWAKVEEHYICAAEILQDFDPEDLKSPSLAAAWHRLFAIEGASSKLDDMFDTWRDLDPMSAAVFNAHSFHCLPRWGGSYEKILTDARRIAAASSDQWGMAAYPLYLIQLNDAEPEIFDHIDLELFEEGVRDLLTRRDHPSVVNFWLHALNIWATAISVETGESSVGEEARAMADRLLEHIVRNHLSVIDETLWDTDVDLAQAIVACVFRTELEAGQRVVIGEDGKAIAVDAPQEQ